jgi:hypothetical protein
LIAWTLLVVAIAYTLIDGLQRRVEDVIRAAWRGSAHPSGQGAR